MRKDFRLCWITARRFLNRNRWLCVWLTLVLVGVVVALHPSDHSVLKAIRSDKSQVLRQLAYDLGHWGDFAQYNVGLFLVMWVVGMARGSRWLQRLAMATLVGAILGGMFCNMFRFTMGRPRPYKKVEDRFHGVEGMVAGWSYHSFPSGHTSTAFGTGVPMLLNAGPAGWGCLAFSASVGWARMRANQHYPTDVLAGAYLGSLFGVAVGWHLRRVRHRLRGRGREGDTARARTRLPGWLRDLWTRWFGSGRKKVKKPRRKKRYRSYQRMRGSESARA